MRSAMILGASVLTLALTVGCGVDPSRIVASGDVASRNDASRIEPSRIDAYCNKADACNFLVGIGIKECVENVEKCAGTYTPTRRADWDKMVDTCNGYTSCSLFGACAAKLYNAGLCN